MHLIRKTAVDETSIPNECDECGADCEVLIHIGHEPDYGAIWQDLCRDCVAKALSMFPA